jgi:hypothetical protein
MKKLTKLLRRPALILAGVGTILLLLVSLELFAQETGTSSHLKSPESVEPASSPTVATKAAALLPTIPQSAETPLPWILPKGISRMAPAMPGMPALAPDAFKKLYGFSGPYYNTTDLDNRVAVLENSVYTWPISSWKATGLLRNQTERSVHLKNLAVHLLGAKGEVLATASATPFLEDLRPGEPVPFVIQAAFPSAKVKALDWQVDWEPAQGKPRPLVFQIDEAKIVRGTEYVLFGSLRNATTTTTEGVSVLAAWLDKEGRVLYVASPKIRLQSDPTKVLDSMSLPGNDEEDFIFSTNDRALASLLVSADVTTLWGIAK